MFYGQFGALFLLNLGPKSKGAFEGVLGSHLLKISVGFECWGLYMLILVNDLENVKKKGWKSVEWAKGN